jgi:hypothetical protein
MESSHDPGTDGAGAADGSAGGFTPGFDDAGLEYDYDPEVMALLDAWEPPEYLQNRPLPSRLVTWRRSSLLGAVMTGWALGLREVLEPKRDEQIVIEVDADGEPHGLPIRLLLDPDDPSGSLCIVRRDPPEPLV